MSPGRAAFACGLAAAAVTLSPAYASAQAAANRSRVEVSAGVEWIGHASFGTISANEVVASGGAFQLFSASTELGGAAGVDVRIGYRLWRMVDVEAASSYSRPELRSTTAADVEGAPALTATDRLRQFTIEGDVLVSPERWRLGRRAAPFVSAGAGYLRHLHEGDTFAENGQVYAFGGGVRIPLLSRQRAPRALGLRADVLALVRARGAAIDGASHISPAVSVSAYVGFGR
jgi:opacity protein-like surface antigen